MKNHNLVLILPILVSKCQKLTCKCPWVFTFPTGPGAKPKATIFIDKLPALTPSNTSKILTDNLAALHKAREAFVTCENLEKIRHALSNNKRTSRDTKYVSGDSVYFKKANYKRWKTPTQDGQQVLVKYEVITFIFTHAGFH